MPGSQPTITSDTHVPSERVIGVAIPVAVAVLTWLVGLVTIGVGAGIGSPGILDVLALFVIIVMWWPVYRVAPWQPGMAHRVLEWGRDHRAPMLVAGGLVVVRSLPVTPGILVAVLDLPFRSATILFGVSVFYRQQVGSVVGHGLFKFGQWYLEAYWLLVIGLVIVGLGTKLRGRVDRSVRRRRSGGDA